MEVTYVQLQLDADTAKIYAAASPEKKQKLAALISLWLHDLENPSQSLSQLMDRISDNAKQRGLTPEVLESLLNEE